VRGPWVKPWAHPFAWMCLSVCALKSRLSRRPTGCVWLGRSLPAFGAYAPSYIGHERPALLAGIALIMTSRGVLVAVRIQLQGPRFGAAGFDCAGGPPPPTVKHFC